MQKKHVAVVSGFLRSGYTSRYKAGGGIEYNMKICCIHTLRYCKQRFCKTLHSLRHIAGFSPMMNAPGTIFCKRGLQII